MISRREFTTGVVGVAAAAPFSTPLLAQAPAPSIEAAIAAIRAHADAHMRYFALPGMTLGLTAPNGFSTVLNFGYAEVETRAPIGPDTLFQIGSISKMMTAVVVHQLAAEGRLKLEDRVSSILPEVPLPSGNAITRARCFSTQPFSFQSWTLFRRAWTSGTPTGATKESSSARFRGDRRMRPCDCGSAQNVRAR